MKVAIISDVHIDINKNHKVTEAVIDRCKKEGAELLLIAGDISEEAEATIAAVKSLKEALQIPVYYVPGNHDMWNKHDPSKTTEDIYKRYQEDENCLTSGAKQITEDTTLIGDIAWFDYSFGNGRYSTKEFDQMTHMERTWQDKKYNDWSKDNQAKSEEFISKLEEQLKACTTKNKIVMTHMVPIEEFTVQGANELWYYFNAFIGTKKLHELYQKYGVQYGICGHIHYRKMLKKGDTTYICPCLNYDTEWLSKEKDIVKEVEEAMVFLEIE
ncbi:MAG: metallophosphoesterase [bacterium]|nr:metallophosphoesterase [bacterium]